MVLVILTYDQSDVLALVWSAPWCSTRHVVDETGRTHQQVLHLLAYLRDLGLVTHRVGPRRAHEWTCAGLGVRLGRHHHERLWGASTPGGNDAAL